MSTVTNPALIVRQKRCEDWIVELIVRSATPGRLSADQMDTNTNHAGWRKAFTRRGITNALNTLQEGESPTLVRDPDGTYILPAVALLATMGLVA